MTICKKCNGSGLNQHGGSFRNYTHLFEQLPGGEVVYANASKAEKPAILAFLRRPKLGLWFAAIADSGQKHVLPWAPINGRAARGRVLFDETVVELPDAAGWTLVDEIAALLTAGATKEEIGSGDYGPGSWTRCMPVIRAFEEGWGGGRHGAWFGLALWLAQRDEAVVAARFAAESAAKTGRRPTVKPSARKGKTNGDRRSEQGTAADAHGGGAVGAEEQLPADVRQYGDALPLGADREPGPQRNAHNVEPRGVGHRPLPQPPPVRAKQLALFGDG